MRANAGPSLVRARAEAISTIRWNHPETNPTSDQVASRPAGTSRLSNLPPRGPEHDDPVRPGGVPQPEEELPGARRQEGRSGRDDLRAADPPGFHRHDRAEGFPRRAIRGLLPPEIARQADDEAARVGRIAVHPEGGPLGESPWRRGRERRRRSRRARPGPAGSRRTRGP